MTQMERNPLSIRHDVVDVFFAEFHDFGMSRWQTKKGESALQFHILWNLNEHILNSVGKLVVKIYRMYLQCFVKTGTHFHTIVFTLSHI
jgi:hypothetical protein